MIWLLLALGFGASSASSFRSYFRKTDRNQAASAAVPLRMEVDVSQPRVYEGKLHQDYTHTCQQVFRLEGDGLSSSEADLERSLAGLRGRLTITHSDGKVVLDAEVDETTLINVLGVARAVTWTPGFRRSPFYQRGDYQVKLVVQEGAPALGGHKQFLVSRYELCGIESLQATVLAVIGGALLLLAIIPAVLALRGPKRAALPEASE